MLLWFFSSVLAFIKLDYDLFLFTSLYVSYGWDLLRFLDLRIYRFYPNWKNFGHYHFKYFCQLFFSVFRGVKFTCILSYSTLVHTSLMSLMCFFCFISDNFYHFFSLEIIFFFFKKFLIFFLLDTSHVNFTLLLPE